jgi:hypothetical protein
MKDLGLSKVPGSDLFPLKNPNTRPVNVVPSNAFAALYDIFLRKLVVNLSGQPSPGVVWYDLRHARSRHFLSVSLSSCFIRLDKEVVPLAEMRILRTLYKCPTLHLQLRKLL